VGAVVPHQVNEDHCQVGWERASAFPTGEDPIVVLDQFEQGPREKLVGLAVGQSAAPAQRLEFLMDEDKVALKKRSSTVGLVDRSVTG
jgi:hypothetical protein